MREFHAEMVRAEYEGTIIRNAEGLYRCDYRSADLQKYKDFIDEEFEIIGGKEGIGKDEGAVTFICLTEEGKPFDCRPRGTYEQRQEWWKKLGSLLGKKLTVRYQTRSDDNIPIFPVGIAIRDYE
jgi:DNA ligase-1